MVLALQTQFNGNTNVQNRQTTVGVLTRAFSIRIIEQCLLVTIHSYLNTIQKMQSKRI